MSLSWCGGAGNRGFGGDAPEDPAGDFLAPSVGIDEAWDPTAAASYHVDGDAYDIAAEEGSWGGGVGSFVGGVEERKSPGFSLAHAGEGGDPALGSLSKLSLERQQRTAVNRPRTSISSVSIY